MSRTARTDTAAVARWTFFTNHLHVLVALAEKPDLRLREIASRVGITERATHRIICELVAEGYLTRTRVGARNHYEVHRSAGLRHPLHAKQEAERVIRLLAGSDESRRVESPAPLIDAAADPAGDDMTFRQLFLTAPVGMALGDESGNVVAANTAFCRILNRREDELIGRDFRELTHPDDVAADEAALREFASGARGDYVREKRYIRPDGSVVWARLRGTVTSDPHSGARRFVAHVVDISERRRQDQALTEAEERFRIAFDNAPIGMALVTPDGRFIKVNRSLCELTGFAETALLIRSFQDITHPDDLDADLGYVHDVLAGRRRTYQMEKRYFHADGHVIWVMLSVSLVRDPAGEPLYFISQIEDITDRKRREEALRDEAAQLAVIASTDPLTGLGTRREWDLAIERISREEQSAPFGIALIDLDCLKEINDAEGHHAGDDALVAMASALRSVVRDADLVARIGGDEFAILIPGVDEPAMLALAERILAALPEPLTASAGVAAWNHRESAVDLERRADRALYAAKRAGKKRVRLADLRSGPDHSTAITTTVASSSSGSRQRSITAC
jgi:PAS domain S-box-containing protein/diguanylate cyclase (GGDEF)-like protein